MTVVTVSGTRGAHPLLEVEQPYLFVDTCMQIQPDYPDADLANAHRHGVTACAVTTWDPHASLAEAVEKAMRFHLMARKHPNILVVNEVEDIRRARCDNRLALILAAQDGDFIGNSGYYRTGYKLYPLEAFYRLGLRIMLPAYNRNNIICGGCEEQTDPGLSAFGKLVVAECNRLGLLLDCSHLGKRSSLDILDRSSHPAVFTHSNASAVVSSPRNIDDEQIKACAAKGGVIGFSPLGPFVLKKGRKEQPTLGDFADHFDHVAQLIGSADNIGIGTDFAWGIPESHGDPWGEATYLDVSGQYDTYMGPPARKSPDYPRVRYVKGFHNYAEVLNLVGEFRRRGYSDQDLQKILGENWLRVFGQVWK